MGASAWRGSFTLGIGALLLAIATANAQELEPRTYANTPVGLNFLIAGYAYSDGGLSTNPALPIKDAQLSVDSLLLAYARSLDVGGKSGKIDFILPYSKLSGSAVVAGDPVDRRVDGFGDPRFRFSVLLYGAPALSLQDFSSYHQDTIVGVSLQVTAPGEQYDSSRVVNLGTNRWSVKPDIGISKAVGKFTLELSGDVTFYTDNNDFYGGRTLEQDPLYSAQAHVIYGFANGMWGALDGTWYYGGETTIDGVSSDNKLNNSRVGATLALPVNRRNSIKLYASTGISTRAGSDFNLGGIAWQYRWGGGL